MAARPYAITQHTYTVKQVIGPPSTTDGSWFPARTLTEAVHTERAADYRRVSSATTYDSLGRVT